MYLWLSLGMLTKSITGFSFAKSYDEPAQEPINSKKAILVKKITQLDQK
jgi:hypothetical protein